MKFGTFLKNVLLIGIPVLIGKYSKKNPGDRETLALVQAVLIAQYGKGLTRAQLLDEIEAKALAQGWTQETLVIIRTLAEAEMDRAGIPR